MNSSKYMLNTKILECSCFLFYLFRSFFFLIQNFKHDTQFSLVVKLMQMQQ